MSRFQSFSERGLITVLTGLSLFFVLYIYNGYGIQKGESFSGHSLFIRALIFGLATSGVYYFFEFSLSRLYNRTRSISSFILWHLVELLSGTCVTFLLFNYFWNWTEWTWPAFGLLFAEYSAVILVPVVIVRLYHRSVTRNEEFLEFHSENRKQMVRVKKKDLYFLKSADNYVEINFRSSDDLQRELLRTTLKECLAGHPGIKQCHRSYAVNPEKIELVLRRNKEVVLDIGVTKVPVSRKYQEEFE